MCFFTVILCNLAKVAFIINLIHFFLGHQILKMLTRTFLEDLLKLVEVLRNKYPLICGSIELDTSVTEEPTLEIAVL